MLKVLIKKQFNEIFKSYFFDAKKNRMRPKGVIIGWFVFFFVIMVVFLGGMFTFLSVAMCPGLVAVDRGWLYFLIMSGIAIALGALGSVFSTYSCLYLPKDNDLLLSMPIPVSTIIASRLMSVYLMGTMYVATVMIPALIVYWVVAGATFSRIVCGIILFLIISLIVLMISCLLGWVVAKLSLKLKNKSIVTVLIALAGIGLYYFVYFKVQDLIRDLIQNAETYGENIRGAAYGLYMFGRIGEGDWLSCGIFVLGTAVLAALVWLLLSRSFLNLATAGGSAGKTRYREKTAREKSRFGALLGKEASRFVASPNYMLNCGLAAVVLPAGGIALLIKGRELTGVIDGALGRTDMAAVFISALICLISVMNCTAAPSVSLEGKSIWIPQSLPVEPGTVLRAKAAFQMLFSGIPALVASVCAAVVTGSSVLTKVMIVLLPLSFTAFFSAFCTMLGVRMPILNWTSEITPIKQGGAVVVAIFGGWGIAALCGAPFLLLGIFISAPVYMIIWTAIFSAGAFLLFRWINNGGAERFATL